MAYFSIPLPQPTEALSSDPEILPKPDQNRLKFNRNNVYVK